MERNRIIFGRQTKENDFDHISQPHRNKSTTNNILLYR